ncbi:MAG TPA: LuxR C-terminal-related transcriptional regulator, partial [Ktedonobacteraceae bacterium]|nr:LuxR C-terminal-related transcriptional regulator [Ktedonobacteraceae bacterium]
HNNSAFSQALILLEHLGNLATQIGSYGWLIEIQILAALARQAQGKTKQALTTLGSILARAEPEGYMRLFIDEGQPMQHLLTHVAAYTTASPTYLQKLLAAFPTAQPAPSNPTPTAPQQALIDPLSTRELEVLRLLAAGSSNQEIANQLIISLHTVKLHVKHILAKLIVTNRTQAVARARELRIL